MEMPGVALEWKRVSEDGCSGRVSLWVMRRESMSATNVKMSSGSASSSLLGSTLRPSTTWPGTSLAWV